MSVHNAVIATMTSLLTRQYIECRRAQVNPLCPHPHIKHAYVAAVAVAWWAWLCDITPL